MIVYQLVPALHDGDAIGNSVRMIKNFLIEQGMRSEIYSPTIDPCLEMEARPFARFFKEYEEDSVTILHFMLPSQLTDAFRRISGKKILIYHNVTPASFFAKYSRERVRLAVLARRELNALAPFPDIALGDSEFNRKELDETGFKETAVLPLPIDFRPYRESSPSPSIKHLLSDGRANILFVGRMVPNKRVEDVLKTASYYKYFIGTPFRFIVVGKTSLIPGYYGELLELMEKLKLTDEDIIFTGHITFAELITCYLHSTCYLSLSEHEGFCLPLVESMLLSLPIIAYDAGAVAETLGGAGLLLKKKDPAEVAELISLLATDGKLRRKLIEKGKKRVTYFAGERTLFLLLDIIKKIKSL
jgi:glycosyltransferase involved in cell wall biosynthesis